MDRVKQVYASLSASERKGVRTYLEAFHIKGENKPLELLKLIEKNPAITHDQAASKLYNDPRSKAFIMMKGRLLEKMVEFLPLSVNPDSSNRDDAAPFHDDLVEFRSLMLKATEMQKRQLGTLALEYLEQARVVAARCNSSELEVDAMLRLRGLDRTGLAKFEELSIDIQKALVKQESEINAGGLMRKFLALHGSHFTPEEEIIAFLETHISELEEMIRQAYSPKADYFLQMLKLHLCVLLQTYEPGKEALDKVTQLLRNYDGIRSPLRLGDSWIQLSRLELSTGRAAEAIVSIGKAQELLKPTARAQVNIAWLKVCAYFCLKQHDKVAEVLDYLKQEPLGQVIRNNMLARGLMSYYSACLAHAADDYQAAWMHLQNSQDANLGKDTWLTGIRLFEIMVLVDKDEYDLAGQKLENLRKHLSRYNVSERMRVGYKLLSAQERIGFSFRPVAGEDALLRQLRSELRWDPTGQEIVRFDEWYAQRRARNAQRERSSKGAS